MTTDANRQSFLHCIGEDGLGIAPLPFSDARARPHPLATFVQKSRLTGAWRDVPVKRYTAALDTPGGSQAPATMDAVREDPLAVQGVSHHPRRPAPWTRASLTLLVDL